MLRMSSSDTSVPIEISATCFTSCSSSSGRMDDRSVLAVFVRSPKEQEFSSIRIICMGKISSVRLYKVYFKLCSTQRK